MRDGKEGRQKLLPLQNRKKVETPGGVQKKQVYLTFYITEQVLPGRLMCRSAGGDAVTDGELIQEKKDYLYSYKPIERRIRQIEEDITRLELEADGARAIQYSDMPKGSADLQSPQEKYVILLEKAIENRIKAKAELVQKREEIKQAIHKIGDADMECLLEYKYLDRLRMKQISQRMKYERTQLYRIHDKAIETFQIPYKKNKDGTLWDI